MGAEKIDEEVQKSKRALFDLRIAQRTKQVGRYRPWTCFVRSRGLAAVSMIKFRRVRLQPFKPSDFWYHKKKVRHCMFFRNGGLSP